MNSNRVASNHICTYNHIINIIVTIINHIIMRTKHYYTLLDKNLNQVQIDLANYKCICNVTKQPKSFHHKYLNDLIMRKYNSNIDLFREGYISRAGTPRKTQAERLDDQIARARARLNQLLDRQTRLETLTTSA